MATCHRCSGKGTVKCPDCHGKGKKDYGGMLSADWKECKHCRGSGEKTCPVCDGKGRVS